MTDFIPKVKNSGFTLVEVLVVVVILGLIAAIAIPILAHDLGQDAEKIAFMANIKTFAKAADVYFVINEEYLENSCSGVLPTGFGTLIDQTKWTSDTPIGGVWDTESDSFGIKFAVGVHFTCGHGTARSDTYMTTIDSEMDDGNLSTGQFRKIASDRYYYILRDN